MRREGGESEKGRGREKGGARGREGGRDSSEEGFIEGRNRQPDLSGSRNGNAESPLKWMKEIWLRDVTGRMTRQGIW